MFTPDGFNATNVPLQLLLREAYGVEDDQISTAPNWVKTEKFDIEAKVDGSDVAKLSKLSFEQHKLMLQPLLEDRFKLKFHRETKDLPVYALVIAKNGLKIKEATPGDTYPNGLKLPGGHVGGAGTLWIQNNQLTGQAIALAELCRLLSRQLGRIVLDRTGLTGKYDFILKWTPDEGPAAMSPGAAGGRQGADNAPPPDSSGPSIFTAIQEQLGLKLESQKAPLEVLVIDHVETPSEN